MTAPKLSTFGCLKEGDLYVERPADDALLAALRRGEYAYVLSSRQTGKSSLMSRTMRKLRQLAYRCVKIDLGGLGSASEPSLWYQSLALEIAEALDCEETIIERYFASARGGTPIQRFARFLRDLVARSSQPLVIFIDEIEGFLKLPMRLTDDFLTAVRSWYNDRDREPLYRRLSFCLMGVCTPTELIRDERRTPFNVARGIDLMDFAWEDTRTGFLPVFGEAAPRAEETLRRIYDWTGGHPFLTHRMVEEIHNRQGDGAALQPELVDEVVRELYLGSLGGEKENFLEVERRLCVGQAQRVYRRLSLYRSILGGERVPARGHDLVQLELRLTGLVREVRVAGEDAYLAVRNRVFAAVFGDGWSPRIDPVKLDPAVWMKEQVNRWHEYDRKDAFVLRGEELLDARSWAREQQSLEPAWQDFLDSSKRVDDRERSVRLNILLVMTLWASCFSFFLGPLLQDYWRSHSYPFGDLVGQLYAVPFILALPAGMLADRLQLRPAQMISLGLSLELVGSLILLGDIRYQHAGMAVAAVAFIIGGQVVLRPHAAVLLGLLYPRNDRRLETAFTAFYLSVNLGSLVGPLIGGAMFRQYGWHGAIGTLAGTAALALYGFSVSQAAFSRLSFPLRGVHADASVSRQRFPQVVLLLGLTLLCFWVAFYALSDKFRAFFASPVGSGAAQPNLQSANLFIQGLSSESVTPLFVAFMAPVLLAAMRFSIKSNKSQRMVAKVAGGLLICALALVASSAVPMVGRQIYGYYIALSAAELLVVPTVMALTSSISNQQTLFSLMSGNYLVAGVGILLADHGVGSSGGMLWALAALSAVTAALWLFRRKSWESLLPRPS